MKKSATENPKYFYHRGLFFDGVTSDLIVKHNENDANDFNPNENIVTYRMVIRLWVMVLDNG